MSRSEAREVAYKVLFSHQFTTPEFSDEVIVDALESGQKLGKKDLEFVKEILVGVNSHKDELLNLIARNTSGYSLDRILKTDLVAILLASYELKFTSIPPSVAINEAVNLVKRYSTEKSFGFVNSVLSKVHKEISNGSN